MFHKAFPIPLSQKKLAEKQHNPMTVRTLSSTVHPFGIIFQCYSILLSLLLCQSYKNIGRDGYSSIVYQISYISSNCKDKRGPSFMLRSLPFLICSLPGTGKKRSAREMLFSHVYTKTNTTHSHKPLINSVNKPGYCSKIEDSLPVLLQLTHDNHRKGRWTFFSGPRTLERSIL